MAIPLSLQRDATQWLRILFAAAMLAAFAAPAPAQEPPPPRTRINNHPTSANSARTGASPWRSCHCRRRAASPRFPAARVARSSVRRAPDYPMPPKVGPVPLVVGDGNDIAAQAPSGFISTAIGSFDSLTNVTA